MSGKVKEFLRYEFNCRMFEHYINRFKKAVGKFDIDKTSRYYGKTMQYGKKALELSKLIEGLPTKDLEDMIQLTEEFHDEAIYILIGMEEERMTREALKRL